MTLATAPLIAVVATAAINSAGKTTLTYDHDGQALLKVDLPAGWLLDIDYVEGAKAAGTIDGVTE